MIGKTPLTNAERCARYGQKQRELAKHDPTKAWCSVCRQAKLIAEFGGGRADLSQSCQK
jgi:hypothetical protein